MKFHRGLKVGYYKRLIIISRDAQKLKLENIPFFEYEKTNNSGSIELKDRN